MCLRRCFSDNPNLFGLKFPKPSETRGPRDTESDLGLLLLVLAGEIVREECEEESIWPSIARLFTVRGSTLFSHGQPATRFKRAVDSAARRFELRHAFDIEDTQRYFTTVKLQFGFTYRSAIVHLGDWLDGLGTPTSVQMLLALTPHVHLGSSTFHEAWQAFTDLRRGRATRDQASVVLSTSPWVRPHWRERLLDAAVIRRRPRQLADSASAPTRLGPARLLLRWPEGETPRLFVTLTEAAVEGAENLSDVGNLRVQIDGRTVGLWTRQPNGGWFGPRTVPVDPPNTSVPNLSPALLSFSADSGAWSTTIDLTGLGTRDDVVLFDLGTESLVALESPLSLEREYAVLCSPDLILLGVDIAERTMYASRRIYRLPPRYSRHARLTLDELTYWTPSTVDTERQAAEPVVLSSVAPIVSLGSVATLCLSRVPLGTRGATLHIGDQPIALGQTMESPSEWTTVATVHITAALCMGVERIRLETITAAGRRLIRPRVALRPLGVAILSPPEAADQATSWKEIALGGVLALSGDSGHLRIFTGADDACSLYEGDSRLRQRIPPRPIAIGKLGLSARGAPLKLIGETEQCLVTAVEDRGRVSAYFYFPQQRHPQAPRLKLTSPIVPDKRHTVVTWLATAKGSEINILSVDQIIVRDGGQVWEIPRVADKCLAVSVVFAGTCVGTWWDTAEIARHVTQTVTSSRDSQMLVALARWFKIPLLAAQLREPFRQAAIFQPLQFLGAMYLDVGLPNGVRQRPASVGLDQVVRDLLWSCRPTVKILEKLLGMFATRDTTGSPCREVASLAAAARICPPLLTDLGRVHLSRYARAALSAYLGLPGTPDRTVLAREVTRLGRAAGRQKSDPSAAGATTPPGPAALLSLGAFMLNRAIP